MRKNDAFDAKIVNTRLTKIFIAIFAPDERLPSSATLDWMKGNAITTRAPVVLKIIAYICVKIFKAQTSSIMKVRCYDKVVAYYMNVASLLRIKLENFSENISSSPSARLINILFCLR